MTSQIKSKSKQMEDGSTKGRGHRKHRSLNMLQALSCAGFIAMVSRAKNTTEKKNSANVESPPPANNIAEKGFVSRIG